MKKRKLGHIDKPLCNICNDTGKLDDAQAWDCGQESSDCPYCPEKVDEVKKKLSIAVEALKFLVTCDDVFERPSCIGAWAKNTLKRIKGLGNERPPRTDQEAGRMDWLHRSTTRRGKRVDASP